MPLIQTFICTDRLGKRWSTRCASAPAQRMARSRTSTTRFADYDHCPSWCVFDQTLFEAGLMSTRAKDWFGVRQLHHHAPLDEIQKRLGEGWSDDNQAEVEQRVGLMYVDTIEEPRRQDERSIDKWMDAGTPGYHHRHFEPGKLKNGES